MWSAFAAQMLARNGGHRAPSTTPSAADELAIGRRKATTGSYAAAARMRELGAANVLQKGGHFVRDGKARDFLFESGRTHTFEAEFIETTATHGTGCTLAAAITANLALGHDLTGSVRIAKEFVTEAIRTAPGLGKGNSPINI